MKKCDVELDVVEQNEPEVQELEKINIEFKEPEVVKDAIKVDESIKSEVVSVN
jgi:hypothetical protein